MKYNVGDYVKIREDLAAGQMYGGVLMVAGMLIFRGHLARIISIDENGNYILSIGGYYHRWSDKMLESVTLARPGEMPAGQSDDGVPKKSTLPPAAQKLSKLIGALFYSGVDEFSVQYDHGAIRCSVEIDGV